MRRSNQWTLQSQTSPKNGRRGCLCKDGKSYSIKCCDGSLQAQGIGNIDTVIVINNRITEIGDIRITQDGNIRITE